MCISLLAFAERSPGKLLELIGKVSRYTELRGLTSVKKVMMFDRLDQRDDMFSTVQTDVLSKGLGEFVLTERTVKERCNTESILRA